MNLDVNIGRIFEACEKYNYVLVITADHGNAEKMITENGAPFTAHTLFRGKVILVLTYHCLVLLFVRFVT